MVQNCLTKGSLDKKEFLFLVLKNSMPKTFSFPSLSDPCLGPVMGRTSQPLFCCSCKMARLRAE